MVSIKLRLLSAEDDFLSALSGSEGAMIAFHARWEALVAEVDSLASSTGLDDEVSALCHTVATRISILADISAELTTTYDTHTSLLMGQLDNLMCKLSLEDEPPSKSPNSTTPTRKRKHSSDRHVPSKGHRVPPHTTSNVDEPPSVSPPSMPSPTTTTLRKRRFSDANTDAAAIPPSKRLHFRPRLHAVSDSYIPLLQPISFFEPSSKLGQATSPNSSPILDIQPFDVSQLDFTFYGCAGSHCNGFDAASFPAAPLELDVLDDFIQSLDTNSFNVEPSMSPFFPDDAHFLDPNDVPCPVDLPAAAMRDQTPLSPSSSSSTTSSCPITPPTKSSLELTIDFPPTSSISETLCHTPLLDDSGCGTSLPEIAFGMGKDPWEDMPLLLGPIDRSMCYLRPPSHMSPGSNPTALDEQSGVFNLPPVAPIISREQEALRSSGLESGLLRPALISCC